MCSIIGYQGTRRASPLLLNGLRRMEYRGYDSAGIATLDGGRISVRKGVGKVTEVNAAVHLGEMGGQLGVGHTRWATHGGVSEVNAHPHVSNSGEIAVVHNGIIENFAELKRELEEQGYVFRSQTDTEVIVNLLQSSFERSRDPRASVLYVVSRLEGTYSFAAIFPDGTLAAARFREPLIVGVAKDGLFVSSDILGFLEQTDRVVYIDNRQFVVMRGGRLLIADFDGRLVHQELVRVADEIRDADRGDYVHYTLKEIFEQPRTTVRTAEKVAPLAAEAASIIKSADHVYLTGSGSSFHAALVGKYLFSKFGGVSTETIIASEARFAPQRFSPSSVMVAISQSGESADVLEAVAMAKEDGARVISIVNVPTSSLARMSSFTINLACGPEIGVAATKSFTSQLVALYSIAQILGGNGSAQSFELVGRQMSEVLQNHSKVSALAERMASLSDVYVLGTGVHYCVAAEGSLKIKELAYVHAEALPGGELKHGPLALLDSNSFVIVLNPSDLTHRNLVAGAHEVRARGAKVVGISDIPSDTYDYWINIPGTSEELYPLLEVIPLQLLAYHMAVRRNANPDYPRNLAKSVTVK